MKIIPLVLLLLATPAIYAQTEGGLKISIRDAVAIACSQSPDILAIRHSFRAAYWNYVYYKANYLPSITLSTDPYFNHQINAINLPDGTFKYVEQNQLITDASLSITQNILLTGGTLSVNSGLQRMDLFGKDAQHTYLSTPINLTYSQSLTGYNTLRWDKKTEPLRYKEAKQAYVEKLENVSMNVSRLFFNLARAQTNLNIANVNYANADTLYTIAKGRYDIGTITESDMLSLEVKRLTEESNMMDARIEVDNSVQELRIYLGITDSTSIEAVVDKDIPVFTVNHERATGMALTNSPEIINMDLRLKESQRMVAQAKSLSGLKADIFAQFGLTQTGRDLDAAYTDPLDKQYVRVGLQIPILDWGRAKGRVQVAKSQNEMEQIRVEQDKNNFTQNIHKVVKQFNQQIGKVTIAAKTEATAVHRNNITLRLYMLGKSTILDINSATAEKDAAQRSYVNALSNYWALYYTLRSLTLYDFEKDSPLTADYELLLK